MTAVPRLDRPGLEGKTVRVLRPRTWIAPEVRLLDLGDRLAVLKDFSALPVATRLGVGLPLIRREVSILRRLVGLPGVPQLIAAVDRFAFVMSHIEARMLYKVPPAELPPGVFARVLELLASIHERGVVHLDLRQRKNVLVAADGSPAIIDFASALHFRGRNAVFRFMTGLDRTAILKLKHRVLPGEVTEEEKGQLRAFDRMRRFWIIQKRRRNPKDAL
jgi:RIO-like serine/threonine protein kinase